MGTTTLGDTVLLDKVLVEFHADRLGKPNRLLDIVLEDDRFNFRDPHSGCPILEERKLEEGHSFATDTLCVTITRPWPGLVPGSTQV